MSRNDGDDAVVTDDAEGGFRGTRARPSPELLAAFRDAYGIPCTDAPVDLGGSSSLNLLVGHADARCVLRVYRPHVTATRLRDTQLVRGQLSAAGVPCPELLATRDGRPWAVFQGRLLELERYVEHDAGMDSWERLEAGMRVLGRMHAALRDVAVSGDGKTPMFANHIEALDALDGTLRGTRRIRDWRPSSDELLLAEAAEALAQLVSSAERRFIAQLRRQLVHGDFWDNNVLFRDGRVALVTDFDFMGERARIDDLALTLYFTCMRYLEEPVSDEQLRRLRRLVDTYDADLDDPLSSTERIALPLAIARQPLWSIAVWVALLDDEAAARRHARVTLPEVQWALGVVREIGRWQAAFA
jgi:Ser/Thr protein kinase RdoA (MazF antagonist)